MNYDYFAEKHRKYEGKQTCHRNLVLDNDLKSKSNFEKH